MAPPGPTAPAAPPGGPGRPAGPPPIPTNSSSSSRIRKPAATCAPCCATGRCTAPCMPRQAIDRPLVTTPARGDIAATPRFLDKLPGAHHLYRALDTGVERAPTPDVGLCRRQIEWPRER